MGLIKLFRTARVLSAIASGNVHAVQRILKKVDVNSTVTAGWRPIHLALAFPKGIFLVELLLKKGADVEVAIPEDHFPLGGAKPLHLAVEGRTDQGSVNAAKLLIASGANVNAVDDEGRTPLHQTARTYNAALAAFLIQKGADVSVSDREEKTPLDVATRHASDDARPVVRVLRGE